MVYPHPNNILTLSVLLLLISCIVVASGDKHNLRVSQVNDMGDGIPVGGWGDWKYIYEPSYLPLPSSATVEHAHGIVIQDDGTLIITYKDKVDPSKCLLQWNSSYKIIPEFLGPGEALCWGVPHGLRADLEDDKLVLYHANNNKVLHKTTMEGDILWTVEGKPNTGQKGAYSPTWFAPHPKSPYVHLADGYGSSNIYVFDKANGTFTGHVLGGRGKEHGKFETCHAIAWDWRYHQMLVIDRENHRLEYFNVDPNDPSVFDYTHTVSFAPLLMRPCNVRMRKLDGMAIVPFLEGPVGIVDQSNNLVSVINITSVLGDQGFLHPHDAHFMPDDSGDFVLVTWNPGRIGYFRRVSKTPAETTAQ